MLEGLPVSYSQNTSTHLVLPTHTNSLGTIFGGVVMSWIDIISAISAQKHSSYPVVTASVDALQFVSPVKAGWVVKLKASVNYVGKTSMEVGVRVDSYNHNDRKEYHTASAYLTFVALDSQGKATAVPPLILETDEDQRRYNEAQVRRKARLEQGR